MGRALSDTDKRLGFLLLWPNLVRYHKHPIPYLNRKGRLDLTAHTKTQGRQTNIWFASDAAFFFQPREIKQRKEENVFFLAGHNSKSSARNALNRDAEGLPRMRVVSPWHGKCHFSVLVALWGCCRSLFDRWDMSCDPSPNFWSEAIVLKSCFKPTFYGC